MDIKHENDYYHGGYLRISYECEDCNLYISSWPDAEDPVKCSICGAPLEKKLVPIIFEQTYEYATISC